METPPCVQRGSVAKLIGLLPSAMPEVLFDRALIEISQRAVTEPIRNLV
jgi:hypothetical protein